MRVELSRGQWADLRDVDELTNGQRRPFMLAVAELSALTEPNVDGTPSLTGAREPAKAAAALLATGDALLGALVSAWSFELPIPSADPASLEAIPARDYDALQAAAQEAMPSVVGAADPTRPDSTSG